MIRAGLIGLGKMGLSHQAILNAHPDIDLVAVCDSSGYVLDILHKYTGIQVYSDYRKMLAEVKLDCVVVAAPSRFHGEMVRIEIARDELPQAMTLEMADRLAAIFKRLGYKYVALDLEGYRQGSLNEVLAIAGAPKSKASA